MALARPTNETGKQGEPAGEWLSTHTLQDIRDLAQELSDQGEDVSELVSAVKELEHLLQETKVEDESERTGR